MLYNIFISHSWHPEYVKQYNNLVNLLDEYAANHPSFEYKNYSAEAAEPLDNRRLNSEYEEQIRPASCVLVIAGVYASYSENIQKEVNIAKSMGKTIIAIKPFGNERVSDDVTSMADVVVNWNSESIVQAIKDSKKD